MPSTNERMTIIKRDRTVLSRSMSAMSVLVTEGPAAGATCPWLNRSAVARIR